MIDDKSKNSSTTEDIREKIFITHQDVIGLNFINADSPYFFRRHYRQGLRSHVMEVLLAEDIEIEKNGTVINGTRWYPKAIPHRIFRVFRTRLNSLEHALSEIRRVKITERYLLPGGLAQSREIVSDYLGPRGRGLILCGLQQYVQGVILDPWAPLARGTLLTAMFDKLHPDGAEPETPLEHWIRQTRQKSDWFIRKIKQMIAETQHVPDLAGIGNLIITPSGAIKLVDINNISQISFRGDIPLDDRGYPVCDKSIEALAMLENELLARPVDRNERIYRTFLDPRRMADVQALIALDGSRRENDR